MRPPVRSARPAPGSSWRRVLALGVSFFGLTASAWSQTNEIFWDDLGVPHVSGPTDEAVWYGQGYAEAVDRFALMHRVRMASQGRLAELIGNPAPVLDEDGNPAGMSPVDQDEIMRHLRLYEYAGERYDALDLQTRSALEAYADGVNRLIGELEAELAMTPLLPLPEPLELERTALQSGTFPAWTPQDSIAAWEFWSYFFQTVDSGELNAPVQSVAVDDEAATLPSEPVSWGPPAGFAAYLGTYGGPVPPPCLNAPSPGQAPTFSHAAAVSGARTTSGKAIVYADVQIQLMSPSMMEEIHLVQTNAKSGWNTRGSSITGAPGFFVGFNADVAWGGASLGYDMADLMELDVRSTGPGGELLTYGYDDNLNGTIEPGEIYNFLSSPEEIDVLGVAPDCMATPDRCFTRYWTHVGPVVTPLLSGVQGGAQYVRRSVMNTEFTRHALQSAIAIPKASSADDLRQRLKFWINPPLHVVFGDDNGDIGYTIAVGAPDRGQTGTSFPGQVPFDGSAPRQDWRGFVPFEYLPWSVQSDGVLFTANGLPAGCWYDLPLTLVGESTRANQRQLRLWDFFNVENTGSFTAEDIAELAFDPVAIHRREVVELAVHLRDDVTSFSFLPAVEAHLDRIQPAVDPAPSIGYLNNGAASLQTLASFKPIAGMDLLRIGSSYPLLEAAYGSGLVGAIGFLRDYLDQVDRSDPATWLDPGDPSKPIDLEIATYVQDSLINAGQKEPTNAEFQTTLTIPYFAFAKRFGGELPSANTLKDRDVDLVCQDGNTIWAGKGKSYSHVVDLDAPNDSGSVHPIGNHQDPDVNALDGTLADHFDDSTPDAWKNGVVPGTSTLDPDVASVALPARAAGQRSSRREHQLHPAGYLPREGLRGVEPDRAGRARSRRREPGNGRPSRRYG